VKQLKEQVAKLSKDNLMIQNRDEQYRHELRRREKESQKAQERLQQGFASTSSQSKFGMELMNPLKPNTRAKWKGGRGV
jgi:hypothetical protein